MDSQHRHELHQNDLAEFLTHFREWWIKHGLRTLLIILVVVIVIFLRQTRSARVEDAHDSAWYDLAKATSPEAYLQVAKSHDVPTIKTLAHLRAADLSLAKLTSGAGPADLDAPDGDQGAALTDEQRQRHLDQAEQGYSYVISDPEAHHVMKLNAMLGLAALAESQGDWDAARQWYEQVQSKCSSGCDAIAAIAKSRTAALQRAAIPVVFAPDPPSPPEVEAAQAPEVEPAQAPEAKPAQAPEAEPAPS